MPSFWEVVFAGMVFWAMYEFFNIVEENRKLNREAENRDERV